MRISAAALAAEAAAPARARAGSSARSSAEAEAEAREAEEEQGARASRDDFVSFVPFFLAPRNSPPDHLWLERDSASTRERET